MLFVGCTSFEDKDNIIIQNDKQLSAGFAEETRTYVENDKYLRWHEDDRLTVFYGNTLNDQYRFKGKTGDNSGTFALVPSGELGTGNTLPSIYGIYPYNADARITDDGVITYSLPATQLYAENSFGKGANTMIAVTESVNDTFLSFKNLCGYLKLKLYGNATIKSIEVKGNFAEKIAGEATITAAYGEAPTLEMNTNATQTITLNCGEGVTLGTSAEDATIFWIVIPETTFKYGITITATSTDNKVFAKSTSNSVVIERNTPTPMGALEFVGESSEISPIATSTITYTTDDGNIVDLFTTEGFGAEYLSNVYDKESNIGTITFDGEITTIPAEAFLACSNLTGVQIPNSVKTIAERAFYGCNYMEKIIIPESVTTILPEAFVGCSGEVVINCKINANAFQKSSFFKVSINNEIVGNEAFLDCTQLKEVNLSNLTTIPYCTFQNTGIEHIVIPGCVKTIGDGAFYKCSKLKVALLSDGIDSIGESAFEECSLLQEIKMPNTMKSIGQSAFKKCTSLVECTIPEGVTSLEAYTFYNCYNLAEISIPSTLASITYPFRECGKLVRVNISDITSWLKVKLYEDKNSLDGPWPFTAFCNGDIYVNGELLTDLVIPNNISTINAYAFSYLKNLKSITFGTRVTVIGDAAFKGCKNLTSVSLPRSLSTCGRGAFAQTGITEIKVTKVLTTGIALFSGCSNLSKVVIDEDVETIPDGFFAGCSNLVNVSIPNSVTNIGEKAFCDCIELEEIIIPKNVVTIGKYAFTTDSGIYSPSKLSKIVFQGETPPAMPFNALLGSFNNISLNVINCTRKNPTIYVPAESYETYMNSDWDAYLKNIISPDGNPIIFTLEYVADTVKEGGYPTYINWATKYHSRVVEDYFDNGRGVICFSYIPTIIPDYAFSNYAQLHKVYIPNSINSIGGLAFAGCLKLEEIDIPNNVTEIGRYAFRYTALKKVYMRPITPPILGTDILNGISNDFTIYVPRNSVEEYKTANGWSQYADKIEGYDF